MDQRQCASVNRHELLQARRTPAMEPCRAEGDSDVRTVRPLECNLLGVTGGGPIPMPSIDSLQTLLTNDLRDLLDAENRLTKALPKLAKAAAHDDLRTALEDHLDETEEHVNRLHQALEALGEAPKAKPCPAMKGIVEESSEHLQDDYDEPSLKDAAIIAGAQKSEHYEIASYGTVLAYAKLLGLNEVITLLRPTLDEEKAADSKLTQIAEQIVNVEASAGDTSGAVNGKGSGRAQGNRVARAGNGQVRTGTNGRSANARRRSKRGSRR